MYKDRVIKWLDKQVEGVHLMTDNAVFGNGAIEICDPYASVRGVPAVHIFKGIDIIASCLGQEVEVQDRSAYDDEYPYELSVEYKGVKFFEIRSDKDGK
jgi:hypothetical protein